MNTGSNGMETTSPASSAADGSAATTANSAPGPQPPAPKAGPVLPPRSAKKAALPNGRSSSQQTLDGAAASIASTTEGQGSNAAPPPSRGQAQPPAAATKFMPTLPARQATPASGPVLDPDEPESIQKVRQRIHAVRVSLLRASQRLGYDADNGIVRQVLYRLALAEKLKAPWRRSTRRPDPNAVAAREAARLEAAEAAAAANTATAGAAAAGGGRREEADADMPARQPLGFCVRMMLVGLAGVGKTQLVHALLDNAPGASSGSQPQSRSQSQGGGQQADGSMWHAVDPIEGATRKCCIHKGSACGVPLEILDTPGLLAAASGTSHNSQVLQQIRKANRSFKPDLVVYVDRLDAGGTSRWGGELPALKGLSEALGPATWLNTIVALTHGGATPPLGARGAPLPWDQWANQRSHVLQQMIRLASGDNRLMNPTAFVESHPSARRDMSGAPLLYSGITWRPHILLMVISAKLLSDTENMLQDGEQGKSAGAAAAAQQLQMMQMMGGQPRSLPLPYLISQATQFSQPLKYPDHDQVMAVRRTEVAASSALDPRQRKMLVRQAKGLRLQIKQAVQYKDKMARSFRMATLAGSKVTPEPPPLASKRPPSAHPPGTFRYRVPEPSGGWVVRPSMEPHGMDVGDGIEGLQMEQYTVAGRRPPRRPRSQHHAAPAHATKTAASALAPASTSAAPASAPSSSKPASSSTTSAPSTAHTSASASATPQGVSSPTAQQAKGAAAPPAPAPQPGLPVLPQEDLGGAESVQLGGAPVHHFLSAQGTKGHLMLQGRTETTLYHDPLGNTTSSLSADLQATRTASSPLDALLSLRADVRRKALPLLPGGSSNRTTAGLMLTRLAEGGRLDRGPIAMGGRLQNSFRSTLGGGRRRRKGQLPGVPAPPSPGVPLDVSAAVALLCAPYGSTSHATAATLAAVNGGPPASLDPELCLGCNMEVTAEAQGALGTRRSAPLTLNANMVSYKGEIMAGLAASLQVRGKRKDACAARVQLSNKGKAGLSIKLRSGPWWWAGLVAMAVPLTNLLLELAGVGA